MDALDTKTQRAYARTRSIAHTRPKAVKLALTDERRYRLAKGYGAGSDREHNLGKIAKHEEEGLQDSTVLSPVVPTQVVEPVWWPKVTTREVRLDELPVKVKRHRRGVSGEYEVVDSVPKVIALDDGIEEEDDEEDWTDLSAERIDGDEDKVASEKKRSYAQVVKA